MLHLSRGIYPHATLIEMYTSSTGNVKRIEIFPSHMPKHYTYIEAYILILHLFRCTYSHTTLTQRPIPSHYIYI